MRLLEMIASKNMKYGFTGRDQIIGDDPPMTTPPYCFGAHNCAPSVAPQFAEL